jgi:molybdopterin/thiamine biosynthesis adenylyltransferase
VRRRDGEAGWYGWGGGEAAGGGAQRALVEARICLLTAGPTGSESLKNLVLPGCGHVTVVDGEVVTEADVGNNFFVDHASVGAARAEVRGGECAGRSARVAGSG